MSYLLLTINFSNGLANWAICTFPNGAIYVHSQVHKFMVSLYTIVWYHSRPFPLVGMNT